MRKQQATPETPILPCEARCGIATNKRFRPFRSRRTIIACCRDHAREAAQA